MKYFVAGRHDVLFGVATTPDVPPATFDTADRGRRAQTKMRMVQKLTFGLHWPHQALHMTTALYKQKNKTALVSVRVCQNKKDSYFSVKMSRHHHALHEMPGASSGQQPSPLARPAPPARSTDQPKCRNIDTAIAHRTACSGHSF